MGVIGPDPQATCRRVAGILQAGAFWTAVLLPLVWLSLLVVPPIPGADLWGIGLLIVLNAAALIIGHGYNRTTGRTSDG